MHWPLFRRPSGKESLLTTLMVDARTISPTERLGFLRDIHANISV
jgi:hypothetical protein